VTLCEVLKSILPTITYTCQLFFFQPIVSECQVRLTEGNSSPYLATVINTSSLSLLLIYTWQGVSRSLFYKWLGAALNHGHSNF